MLPWLSRRMVNVHFLGLAGSAIARIASACVFEMAANASRVFWSVTYTRSSSPGNWLARLEAAHLRKEVDQHRVLGDIPVIGRQHILRALV